MITLPEIQSITNHYQALPMSAYRIKLKLTNSMVAYDNQHLDAILSYCVINQATQGKGLIKSAEPYEIPLPLKMAWQSPHSLPLWQSTDFSPCNGDDEIYSLFWAKRSIRPELVKRGKSYINIRGTEGADKEFLMPIPAHSEMEWQADFYGNADEVAKLLEQNVGAVGKKRVMGHGVIHSWEIESIAEFSFFANGIAMRPIPFASLSKQPLDLNLQPMAWTPPYWLTTTWLPCLPFGSKYGLP